jgi:hypothetical protein
LAAIRHFFTGYKIIGTNKQTGKREVIYQFPDYDSAVLCGTFGWRAREQYTDLEIR